VAAATILALVSVFGSPGCSYQLDSVRSKSGDEVERMAAVSSEPAGLVSEGDFAVARAAVSEMLRKGGKTTSVPWENPRTGAHGTITPLAVSGGVNPHFFGGR
jgi:hypothetical protein